MQISENQRQACTRIAESHGLDLILAFGSVAAGREHARSDLDVAVRFRRGSGPVSFETHSAIYAELQHTFLERELDLSIIDHADPLFLKKITEHCVLLAGEEPDLYKLKMLAFRRYHDHKRFFAMEAEYVDRFLTRSATK